MTTTPPSATDPATCPHTDATLDAEVTDPAHPDIPHLGIPLVVHNFQLLNFVGARAHVAIGACRDCGIAVAQLSLIHPDHMTASHASLNTGWVPLRPRSLAGLPGVTSGGA